ncbi:hypothetical protein VAA_01344 [Vibrio anguillarum 775]|nr:hypothetical protein VAA_01344 [Vibrio anguillarum 775]
MNQFAFNVLMVLIKNNNNALPQFHRQKQSSAL